eukprot:GHVR01115145.1.p1 GENE.GHVR01115145.1~~GHVR01115145.1.p1  ORF type:complete len:129 (+),score=1.42 GHVR01115145.1:276-662(+)
MNGYITCSQPFYSYWPRVFSSSFDANILAPFWADADGRSGSYPCSMDQDGMVFYQIYENDALKHGYVNGNRRILDSRIENVISRAQSDVLYRSDEFYVSWVAVVTWHRMRPYYYRNYEFDVSTANNIM